MYNGRLRSRPARCADPVGLSGRSSSVLRTLSNGENTPVSVRQSRKRRERPRRMSDGEGKSEDWLEDAVLAGVQDDIVWLSRALEKVSVEMNPKWSRERLERVDAWCLRLGLERDDCEYEVRLETRDALCTVLSRSGYFNHLESPARPLSLPRTESPPTVVASGSRQEPPGPPGLVRCDSLVTKMTQLNVWKTASPATPNLRKTREDPRTDLFDSGGGTQHQCASITSLADDSCLGFPVRAQSLDSGPFNSSTKCFDGALKLSFDSAVKSSAVTSRASGARASLEAAVARFSFGSSGHSTTRCRRRKNSSVESSGRYSVDSMASHHKPRRSIADRLNNRGKPPTAPVCFDEEVEDEDDDEDRPNFNHDEMDDDPTMMRYCDKRSPQRPDPVPRHVHTPNPLSADAPRNNKRGWGSHLEFGDWGMTEASLPETTAALRRVFESVRYKAAHFDDE